MSVKSIIVVFILLFCSTGFSQYDIEKSQADSTTGRKNDKLIAAVKENTYVGSGLNASFGNQFAFLYIGPQIGYEFMSNFSAGVLSSFQYYRLANYTENTFGVGIFSRYILIKKIIFETSFNIYRIRGQFSGQQFPTELRSKSWLAGIGYARQLGNNAYGQFLVSYDLLQDPNNPELGITPFRSLFPNFRLYYKFGITIYPFR